LDDLHRSRPYRTEPLILPMRHSDFSPPVNPSFSPPVNPSFSNLSYSVVLTADLKPHLIELRRGSVTAGVVGNHIFSDCKSSIF
ncbi:unnamed protein product, partial [Brassica rapa subsp. trilocularis]